MMEATRYLELCKYPWNYYGFEPSYPIALTTFVISTLISGYFLLKLKYQKIKNIPKFISDMQYRYHLKEYKIVIEDLRKHFYVFDYMDEDSSIFDKLDGIIENTSLKLGIYNGAYGEKRNFLNALLQNDEFLNDLLDIDRILFVKIAKFTQCGQEPWKEYIRSLILDNTSILYDLLRYDFDFENYSEACYNELFSKKYFGYFKDWVIYHDIQKGCLKDVKKFIDNIDWDFYWDVIRNELYAYLMERVGTYDPIENNYTKNSKDLKWKSIVYAGIKFYKFYYINLINTGKYDRNPRLNNIFSRANANSDWDYVVETGREFNSRYELYMASIFSVTIDLILEFVKVYAIKNPEEINTETVLSKKMISSLISDLSTYFSRFCEKALLYRNLDYKIIMKIFYLYLVMMDSNNELSRFLGLQIKEMILGKINPNNEISRIIKQKLLQFIEISSGNYSENAQIFEEILEINGPIRHDLKLLEDLKIEIEEKIK
ncbi:hypothetical protein [Methanococcus maripaludis]|uniref:Uncharacterized protein n=1 Tax=Methanococcus maripaludis TaxID=39152 RepID=A0A7J9PCY4_METMI|nr:hypothetical protein [Methanococcus maripaludis]MBA2861105.1 hypothetical protein [Methanococcus maripaludis]